MKTACLLFIAFILFYLTWHMEGEYQQQINFDTIPSGTTEPIFSKASPLKQEYRGTKKMFLNTYRELKSGDMEFVFSNLYEFYRVDTDSCQYHNENRGLKISFCREKIQQVSNN